MRASLWYSKGNEDTRRTDRGLDCRLVLLPTAIEADVRVVVMYKAQRLMCVYYGTDSGW